jgi:hypothetical protein
MTMMTTRKTTSATEAEVAAAWARLGVMLNVAPANHTPDVERLLLDTARLASGNIRLFLLAATWLRRFSSYVAGHRLARLVHDELEDDARPVLGLMLEWAGEINLKYAIDVSRGTMSQSGRPLSDAENGMAVLRRQAEQSANALSKKWGRWLSSDAMRMKHDAIRPVSWVARHNSALAARSTLGDVATSVVAEWPKGGEVDGAMEVSRRIGASRIATNGALHLLELAGRVEIEKTPGRRGMIVRILTGI